MDIPPRILYHGTNDAFVEMQVRQYNRYEEILHGVDMDYSIGNVLYYATRSCMNRAADPVILVIDTLKVTAPFGKNRYGYWRVPFLDVCSYQVLRVARQGGFNKSELESILTSIEKL